VTKERAETLRALGVDPETVHFYRSRLDCIAPFATKPIFQKMRRLSKLFDKVEAAQMACNELAAELHFLGVPVSIWDGGKNGSATGDSLAGEGEDLSTFEWSPATGAWGYTEPENIYGRIIEEYSSRPDKRAAIDIWNTFVVAFERPPERLFRIHGRGYFVEFRDARGRLLRFNPDDLKGRRRPAAARPIHEFMAAFAGNGN
jgi:hypothetical protein